MNLLILKPHELDENSTFQVKGRRHSHLQKILKVAVGDELKAGVLNRDIGAATVLNIDKAAAQLMYKAKINQNFQQRSRHDWYWRCLAPLCCGGFWFRPRAWGSKKYTLFTRPKWKKATGKAPSWEALNWNHT